VSRLAALVGTVAAVTALTAPVSAQDQPAVRLTLLAQTPFVTTDSPLSVRVGAVNEGETGFGGLTFTVSVYTPARSRSEYAQAIESGPLSTLRAETTNLRGTLEPGVPRSFPPIEMPTRFLVGESALYPVTVELRSNDVPLAVLRTSVVFISEPPTLPLNVSLSFVLDEAIRFRPDGTFLDATLEESIAEGGRLDTVVTALEEVPAPVTLVISPVLLEQLQRMADGYRVLEGEAVREVTPADPPAERAGAFLERIRELAHQPTAEVVALPYASPSIPALVASGLSDDLAAQIDRGRNQVAELLGVEPSATVFRPPGSALSHDALTALAGILPAPPESDQQAALLVDSSVLPPSPGAMFTPPGAAEVPAGAGRTMLAIAPDPLVEDRTRALPEDPRLRAQWTLGELSAIYFEQPSLDRGVALVFGEEEAPELTFLRTLLRGIVSVPDADWLRPVQATRVLVTEAADPPPDLRELEETSRSSLSPSLTIALAEASEDVAQLRSMADQPALVDEIQRLLLLSESRYLLTRQEQALGFVRSARETVSGEFGKVRPPAASAITLTAQRGVIPVTLRNETGYPVRLRLVLRAPRLEFLAGSTRQVTLDRPVEAFTFPVRAQTTGRSPLRIRVETPLGREIGSVRIAVRSTAYNRVALVVTIGAALFLAVWWGRRFLSRRMT
jgi:Family of unknown function (DUF6049)/Glycosyl hydrolase family 57